MVVLHLFQSMSNPNPPIDPFKLLEVASNNPDNPGAAVKKFIYDTSVIQKEQSIAKKKLQYPYYREQYGRQMKTLLDDMINDKLDRVFLAKDYPTIKLSTLYTSIKQGIMYLCDLMDPDNKYKEFRLSTELRRPDDSKLVLAYTGNDVITFKSRVVKKESTFNEVYVAVQEALTMLKDGERVVLPDDTLAPFELNNDQVKLLQELCGRAGGDGIVHLVGANEIKIIKVPKPQQSKVEPEGSVV